MEWEPILRRRRRIRLILPDAGSNISQTASCFACSELGKALIIVYTAQPMWNLSPILSPEE